MAGFLERAGFTPTLIERAPEFKHIGFGMSIFGNGRKILRELGVDDEVAKEAYEIPWVELADANGRQLGKKILFKGFQRFAEPLITIERAALHGALAKNLRKTKLRLGTTIEQFKTEKDKTEVKFSNGEREAFDLVIASDGIHSQIREQVFGHGQNSFYGWSLRFFWVPPHIPVLAGAICLSKERATLALYPLGKRCFAGLYEYNPKRINHPPLPIEGFLPYLSRHGWTNRHIVDLEWQAKNGQQYYDHLQHVALDKWFKKRVALVGDARHGLSPITGMGGSMALEDAFVLADELAKSDSAHIDAALKNYAKRRTARIKKMITLSNMSEKFYFIKTPFERIVRNAIAAVFPPKILSGQVDRLLSEPL